MHRTKTLLGIASLIGMLSAVLVTSAPVGAADASYAGWMVSRNAGVFTTYSPPRHDRWNSQGTTSADEITRLEKGHYKAFFHGYAVSDGLPAVTAIGNAKWCMVWTWGPDTGREYVEIYCYGATGQLADSAFSVSYIERLSVGNPILGYAFNSDVTINHVVSGEYTFDSAGAAIHSVHTSTGHTTVTFDGLGDAGGNVQVSTYLDGVVGSCSTSEWVGVGSNERVSVVCRGTDGAPADIRYDLFYVQNTSLRGTHTGAGAYFLAEQPSASSYKPSAAHRWSTSGQSPLIHRLSTGRYRVSLPGIAGKGGSVQVTAVTSSASRCNVSSIGTSGPTQQAVVRCMHGDGSPADTEFSFMFTR